MQTVWEGLRSDREREGRKRLRREHVGEGEERRREGRREGRRMGVT